MTIDEAIEEMENEVDEHPFCRDLPYYKALMLGIEALKTIKKWREQHRDLGFLLMPGETEG